VGPQSSSCLMPSQQHRKTSVCLFIEIKRCNAEIRTLPRTTGCRVQCHPSGLPCCDAMQGHPALRSPSRLILPAVDSESGAMAAQLRFRASGDQTLVNVNN
jgi:hypothetical protein